MPSPIGHVVAGTAIAWASEVRPAGDDRISAGSLSAARLTVVCAAIATAPDLDLLFAAHRTYTHSVGATVLVAFAAAAVAAWARLPPLRMALVCAAAHASHIVLDWLGSDTSWPYGLQALWPFSDRFYISGLNLFRETARRHFFSVGALRVNVVAAAQEILILGPLAWAAWSVRVKALAGLPPELPRGNHATK